METPAGAMRRLLADEREALARADLERLVALQEPKRKALLALKTDPVDPKEVRELRQLAKRNIELMRQFTSLLRGLATGGVSTYGASGDRIDPPARIKRGSF
ncbi:MAG: hypothetical protein AAGF12_33640 [Myxococcota bacterium]